MNHKQIYSHTQTYNKDTKDNTMSLELLLGPMFAGKSSALLTIVRRHRALGWPVMVITHVIDKRYGDDPQIVNHDLQRLPAIATDKLMPLLNHPDYAEAKLIVVEEAQFFPDLIPFILNAVDSCGKHAVVVGLDGDAERKPFGRVLDLVPYADRITKLTAFCHLCADGTPALFTYAHKEIVNGNPCVGGSETYSPMCRKHYLKAKETLVTLCNELCDELCNELCDELCDELCNELCNQTTDQKE